MDPRLWQLNPPIAILIAVLLGLAGTLFGQSDTTRFWVKLTDKAGTPHSVSNPQTFLSQRSIDRRERFGLPVLEQDLPVDPSYLNQIEAVLGITVGGKSKWFNSVVVHATDAAAINGVLQLPFVEDVEVVRRLKRVGEPVHMADSGLHQRLETGSVAGEPIEHGEGADQITQMRLDYLHDQGYLGQDLHIAVMDGGFPQVDNLTIFQAMREEGRLLGTYDFVDGEVNVDDPDEHGTFVLSILAADVPGSFVGSAPKASYWLFRTEDVESESLLEEENWIMAAEYADSAGVDIINTSLGYTTFDNPDQNHSPAELDGRTLRLSRAQNMAAARGIFLVTSAGNEAGTDWGTITVPADADSVMAVGGVDWLFRPSPGTSPGPTADGRTKPNLAALGSDVVAQAWESQAIRLNGTSYAAPLISGAAACLWQAQPQVSNMELFRALENSGHLAHSPNNNLGHGVPDLFRAMGELEALDTSGFSNQLKLYPNPSGGDKLTVEYWTTLPADNLQLRLIAGSGAEVLNSPHQVFYGRNLIDLYWDDLPDGVYVLEIEGNQQTDRRKVVRTTP